MTTALTDKAAIPPAADAAVPPTDAAVPPADGAPPNDAAVPPAGGTPPTDAVAPADYEFAFPEGVDAATVKIDDIKAFAKDLGLDPVADKDKAQKILDRVLQQRTDLDSAMAQTKADVIAGWAEEAKADKEIGGDKFDAALAAARGVINNPTFVTPDFKTFLEESGLGNHPEMIRVFARLAPHFANDTPVSGNGGSPKGDPLAGLYDNPTSRHS